MTQIVANGSHTYRLPLKQLPLKLYLAALFAKMSYLINANVIPQSWRSKRLRRMTQPASLPQDGTYPWPMPDVTVRNWTRLTLRQNLEDFITVRFEWLGWRLQQETNSQCLQQILMILVPG